ncbi:MAG TPA: DUF6152 family protein [Gammaproteobacteria bacterium]|nr:DUF6152 family protein [Gammaproteobacteria bacterium]
MTLATLLIGAMTAAASPALAHHAFAAEFDADQPITLSGTITRVEWINPHAWLHIDVEDEDGNIESWRIEAGSPNTLVRRGLTRDSILPGTEVVVFGYRHRDGSNAANGRDVSLPDGSKLFLSSPRTGAPGQDD